VTTVAQFVDELPGYSGEQKDAVKAALLTARQKIAYTALNTDVVTADQFAGFIAGLGPQCAAKPDLLFLNFRPAQQGLVDEIGGAWGHVDTMVASGLSGAGLSNRDRPTPYELLFGRKTRFSGSSYALRQAKVGAVLQAVRDGLANKWVVKYDAIAQDIASWSAGNTIAIGTAFRPGGGKFAAGVLIHEMGHRAGLVDVCSYCLSQQLKAAHFQAGYTTAGLNCGNNKEHGKSVHVKDANAGHFIGMRRSKLLATTQKNLTVWNADSYRWYCCYFHRDEVTATTPAGAAAIGW